MGTVHNREQTLKKTTEIGLANACSVSETEDIKEDPTVRMHVITEPHGIFEEWKLQTPRYRYCPHMCTKEERYS